MPIKLKIFLILSLLIFIILIISTIKKGRLLLKYSLLWLFACVFMLICIIFPQILEFTSKIVGVEVISNLVFFMGLFILLVLTFVLNIIVSEHKRKINLLTEEISILKKQLLENKNDLGGKNEKL